MESTKILETKLFEIYKNNSCDHDIGHIKRVVKNAKLIGKMEKSDMDILLPAAMLHDIALRKGGIDETNGKHAILGAILARTILEEHNFKNIDKICSAILQHSLDNKTGEPRTLEGDCLFDSDKLDIITPIGVARYLQQCAMVDNKSPEECAEFFRHWVRRFEFKTKSGKKLGNDRTQAIRVCEEILASGIV